MDGMLQVVTKLVSLLEQQLLLQQHQLQAMQQHLMGQPQPFWCACGALACAAPPPPATQPPELTHEHIAREVRGILEGMQFKQRQEGQADEEGGQMGVHKAPDGSTSQGESSQEAAGSGSGAELEEKDAPPLSSDGSTSEGKNFQEAAGSGSETGLVGEKNQKKVPVDDKEPPTGDEKKVPVDEFKDLSYGELHDLMVNWEVRKKKKLIGKAEGKLKQVK